MQKDRLRKQLLEKRKSVLGDEASYKSSQILKKVLRLPQVANAGNIGTYVSFKSEAQTLSIIESFLKDGRNVFAPFIKNGGINFAKISSLSALSPSKNGFPEPKEKKPVDPASVEVFLVPGIGFDRNGYRIGWGQGFYDRFFNENSITAPKIGIAFDFQVVQKIPHEPHDVRMDAVVTEKKVYGSLNAGSASFR